MKKVLSLVLVLTSSLAFSDQRFISEEEESQENIKEILEIVDSLEEDIQLLKMGQEEIKIILRRIREDMQNEKVDYFSN